MYVCGRDVLRRFADAKMNPAKRAWEVFNLQYAVVWIGCFAVIIAFSLYESFDAVSHSLCRAPFDLPCHVTSCHVTLFPCSGINMAHDGDSDELELGWIHVMILWYYGTRSDHVLVVG